MIVLLASAPVAVILRWALFITTTLVVGAVAYGWCVRAPSGVMRGALVLRLLRGAGVAGTIAAGGRLAQQAFALAPEPAAIGTMVPILLRLPWGYAWVAQVLACVLVAVRPSVVAGATADRRSVPGALVALTLAAVPAFQGHAFGAPEFTLVAVAADMLHVLAAGGWIGTLAIIVVGVLPGAEPSPARAVITAFSPWALAGAAVLAATGVFASWLHVRDPRLLGSTAYGVTLLLKVVLVIGVAGLGALNWKRLSPGLTDRAGVGRLVASARGELLLALLVLAVTAALVGTPLPGE